MRILVCYITVTGGDRTLEFAKRFSESWLACPPGEPTELVIACNGGPPSLDVGETIARIGAKFYPRPNDPSWDIGAFCDVARKFECDCLVCLGESCFFHRPSWLTRIAETWKKLGPGMYGFYSSNLVTRHLNTTAFAIDPKLLKSVPPPTSREERHAWEHGPRPFWRIVQGLGLPVRLVTFDGDYGPGEWRAPANILWKGDQTNCLAWCNHTERFFKAVDDTKRNWEINANVGLR